MLEPLNSFTTSAADFADKPNSGMSAAEVKAQFDAAPEELRVFVNGLIDQLNADFALKSEIATALLGQILDGSLTDVKLSNNVGQVKDRLSKVIIDLSNFIATKGEANGFASLDSSGKVPSTQVPNNLAKIASGSFTGDGTASRTIAVGFTPKFIFVSSLNSSSGNVAQLAITGYDATAASMSDAANNVNTVGGIDPASSQGVVITTNGFTVKVSTTAIGINLSGVSYGWVAFG